MKGKKWTDSEIQYLETWWGVRSRKEIANHLHKSISACRAKADRLGMGSFQENVNGLTVFQTEEIIGVNRDNIYKTWIYVRGLKSHKVGAFSVINWDDLVDFMEKNQDLWDARKCDYFYFYKYPWFLEKLKRERNAGKSEAQKHRWSYWEEEQLRMYTKKGLSYSKIAERLNRTKSSVAKKCFYMGLNKNRENGRNAI